MLTRLLAWCFAVVDFWKNQLEQIFTPFKIPTLKINNRKRWKAHSLMNEL